MILKLGMFAYRRICVELFQSRSLFWMHTRFSRNWFFLVRRERERESRKRTRRRKNKSGSMKGRKVGKKRERQKDERKKGQKDGRHISLVGTHAHTHILTHTPTSTVIDLKKLAIFHLYLLAFPWDILWGKNREWLGQLCIC